MIGEAVLGLGEAGVVFDNSPAVRVSEEEEADCLDRGWRLRVLVDREVRDSGLLEVRDSFAFGVEDGGPGGVDWRERDEGIEKLGPVDGIARFGLGAMG